MANVLRCVALIEKAKLVAAARLDDGLADRRIFMNHQSITRRAGEYGVALEKAFSGTLPISDRS